MGKQTLLEKGIHAQMQQTTRRFINSSQLSFRLVSAANDDLYDETSCCCKDTLSLKEKNHSSQVHTSLRPAELLTGPAAPHHSKTNNFFFFFFPLGSSPSESGSFSVYFSSNNRESSDREKLKDFFFFSFQRIVYCFAGHTDTQHSRTKMRKRERERALTVFVLYYIKRGENSRTNIIHILII